VKAAARLAEVELSGTGLEFMAARRRPILELVPSFEADMRRRALGEKYRVEVDNKLRLLVKKLGVGADPLLEKWTADRITIALCAFAKDGVSARTQNKIHLAASAFSRFLVGAKLLDRNPCEGIAYAKYVPSGLRRNFEPEEIGELLNGVPLYRAAVYIAAATTGLRRRELETRAPEHLNLDDRTLAIEARDAKNSKDEVLPLPPIAIEFLTRYVAGRADGTLKLPRNARPNRLFCVPSLTTFYSDLKRVGIAKENEAGYIDFHSLRVTTASMYARAGVPLTLAQKLMRHSDPRLTANLYTRHQTEERRGAVDAASALWAKRCPDPTALSRRVRHAARPPSSAPRSSADAGRPPPV
jgi:integrase